MIKLTKVSKTYGGAAPVVALRDVDLVVEDGEAVAVVGPSGSGKSTLLHVLGLLDQPSSGSYVLDGEEVGGLPEADRAGLRAETIGFVFQSFHLLSGKTVTENIELSLLYRATGRDERRERAREAAERVGLGHRLDADVATLSGGERQRVAIARAVAKRARLVLCDEPTGNLDSRTAGEVLDLLWELHSAGTTLLVVTHDDRIAAAAQRQIRVHDGSVLPG